MYHAFSFPMTAERSRNKERLEASLAGLCELELRKQRQECLVLGALSLGEPMLENSTRNKLSGFNSWGQDNLTLRRQLSALQSSPWGKMLALEQQVGELRVDTDDVTYEGTQGNTGDSRPSSGFYESSEGQSPKGHSCPSEFPEPPPGWGYSSTERPKSLKDALQLTGESLMEPAPRATVPRSFSAPYPPLEGIAEEGMAEEPWQWDPHSAQDWEDQDQATEEDFQQALRVEGYILGLIHRYTLSPRPCMPRTSLGPDPSISSSSSINRQSSLRRKPPLHTPEHCIPDPQDLYPDPECQAWGCDPLDGEAWGVEAPSMEEDCYLSLPYPPSRPHSLAGGHPPSLDPPCFSSESDSPQHYLLPHSPASHNHLVRAQYIPGQPCHAPVRSPSHCPPENSPSHYPPEPSKPSRTFVSPDQSSSKPRATGKKSHEERQSSKKPGHKTCRSQSENSLMGQSAFPKRRFSTAERPQNQRGQGPHTGPQHSNTAGGRRWCSTLELSQEEGKTKGEQAHRCPHRRARLTQACAHPNPNHHSQVHAQPRLSEYPERAPLCRGEDGYVQADPGESESSMSEVYSPASSSLSSDSDEGGLVWPQQLPPRLAPSSSSSSSSHQASSKASSQPKAFVKIKASHALKKKILRFRAGSLKVMTTV
ncbi:dapper homolog 3-like [Coregonus clupeaformis]|uniref:dapper homolog 3-like n=1 Tax=Coregonus clupeaformis TaxID=59861 RepID=UPI001BE0EB61|nr:dapper homolog 3-like [Coregonus clupeaformis]